MTTIPTITPIPADVPLTSDPANFDARADAFLAALPDMVAEENAVIVAMNTVAGEVTANAAAAAADAAAASLAATVAVSSSAYMDTSSSSLSLTLGAKSVVIDSAGKAFADDDRVTLIRKGAPAVRARGAVSSADMVAKTMTVTFDELTASGGPFTDWLVILSDLEADVSIGRHAIWIPAGALVRRSTNGAVAGATESATNKVMATTFDFDATTVEYAQVAIRMPKSWDEGVVTFVPVWSHGATATNFKVSWGLQGVAISDGDAGDAAFGTAQYSNDTGGTTGALYAGPESAAITIAGTAAAEDLVAFQLLRKADDATNDTLAVDALLRGFTLYITTNAGTDT